jgi:hypothetical protein
VRRQALTYDLAQNCTRGSGAVRTSQAKVDPYSRALDHFGGQEHSQQHKHEGDGCCSLRSDEDAHNLRWQIMAGLVAAVTFVVRAVHIFTEGRVLAARAVDVVKERVPAARAVAEVVPAMVGPVVTWIENG